MTLALATVLACGRLGYGTDPGGSDTGGLDGARSDGAILDGTAAPMDSGSWESGVLDVGADVGAVDAPAIDTAAPRDAGEGGPPPTVDIDLRSCGALPPEVQFERPTAGTYFDGSGVLRLAAAGEPRCERDPATGSVLGLLLESDRTNSLLYSERFDEATAWTGSATVEPDVALAPDGAMSADRVVDSSTTAIESLSQSVSVGNDRYHTLCSVFVRGETSTDADFGCGLRGGAMPRESLVRVDLGAGTALDVGGVAPVGFGVEVVGAGWFRLWMQIQNNMTGNAEAVLTLAPASGAGQPTATGAVVAWGGQVESSTNAAYLDFDYPSSYIPTGSAPVRRDADRLFAATLPWFNPSEGSVVLDVHTHGFETRNGGGILANFGDTCCGGGTYQIALRMLYNGEWRFTGEVIVNDTPVTRAFDPTIAVRAGEHAALGLAYSEGAFLLARDGVVVDTQPGTGVATVPNLANFSVASRQLGLDAPRIRMHLLRYRYFSGALSSAELAAVTTP